MFKINRKVLSISLLAMFLVFLSGCSKGVAKLNLDIFKKEKVEIFTSKDGNYVVGASNRWNAISKDDDDILLSLQSEEYNSNYMLKKEDKSEYSKDMTLDKYSILVGEASLVGLENGSLSESEDITIDNKDGKKFYVKGEKEGIKLKYIFTVLDSEEMYLRQIIWSTEENIEENSSYYYKILGSLKKNVESPQ